VTDPSREPSVLSQLQSFSWSSEDSVAYEAAIEAINGAVGAYSALIAAEEAQQQPDQTVLAAAREGRTECTRWREQLDPADRAAVAETRRRFSQLAEEVRGRRGE
jgi:predicted hotdog family 3-hydroxylacyl-ACP dehydratase